MRFAYASRKLSTRTIPTWEGESGQFRTPRQIIDFIVFGATGTLLRKMKGEVVLVSRLRAALERLNPALPPEAITAAVDDLTRDRSAMSLEAANREVYLLLKEGIKVSVPDRERGGQKSERLRVVDWEHPANNDFLLVSQFSVTGGGMSNVEFPVSN